MNFRPIKNKLSFQGVPEGNNTFSEKVTDKNSKEKKFGILKMMSKKTRKENSNFNSDQGKTSKLSSKVKEFNKKNLMILAAAVAIIVIIGPRLFSQSDTRSGTSTDSVKVKPASASLDINKSFSFPLRDDENEEVGALEYEITKAEKLDEIVVQGSKATAIDGRTFLILNLKIKNTLNQSLEINTKDYVRLSVNGDTENWLAPDIHNDPVKVQAISTKNTRLGFPINDSDKDLVLRVGEINGEKEELPLNF